MYFFYSATKKKKKKTKATHRNYGKGNPPNSRKYRGVETWNDIDSNLIADFRITRVVNCIRTCFLTGSTMSDTIFL